MRPWKSLVFIPSVVGLLAGPPAPDAPARVEARLKRDVAYLASPGLEGRGNGQPGLGLAAARVAGELRALGLKTTVQRFPFVARVVRQTAAAEAGKGEEVRNLVWGRDIEAYGFSADGDFRNKPLAFVGYGLQVPGSYDDLAGIDLKDHVAVIARTVPDLPVFAHLGRGDRSLVARIKRLEAAKVVAVVVLEDQPLHPPRREEGPAQLGLPVLAMPMSGLDRECGELGLRLQKIRETGQPQSRDFIYAPWSTLSVDLELKRIEAKVPNVVAVLPGRDPKLRREFIAVGAHMDHLGRGERHSLGGPAAMGQVHPGADDNASGTAMVLELARELKRARPRRSILLMAYAGEEEGLLGSQYWIQHPTQPLSSVKFMVNFDMVGRLDPKAPRLMMGGLGAPKSAVEAAEKLAPKGFAITADIGAAVGGSDHMSFSQAKIPTFFFFTGLHGDYHRPSDTADRIDAAGMAELAAYGRAVILQLADGDAVPAFDPETAKIPSKGNGGPMRIAFGSIPDYADNPKGFRINGVSAGSTAEALGLQAGDILTRFGDRPVKDIYDFMGALGAYNPGDKVVVQWLRGDRPMQGEATLRGRN
jgi:hypothetical protein